MTKTDFEMGRCSAPERGAEAKGFFSVIRSDSKTGGLRAVPYSEAYQPYLKRIAGLLERGCRSNRQCFA